MTSNSFRHRKPVIAFVANCFSLLTSCNHCRQISSDRHTCNQQDLFNSPRIPISRRIAARPVTVASRIGIAHVLSSAFLTRLCSGHGREDGDGNGGEEVHAGRNGRAGGFGMERDVGGLEVERGIWLREGELDVEYLNGGRA